MTMLSDLKTYLATQAITVSIDRMPDQPNTCALLLQTQGFAPELTHDTVSNPIERPGLQVQVRAAVENASDAWTLMYQINALLVAIRNTSLSGRRYIGIQAVGSPFVLIRDLQRRTTLAANYAVRKGVG